MSEFKIKVNNIDYVITLPLTIGSSYDDSIYVNSENIKKSHFVVVENSKYAQCFDFKGSIVPLSFLEENFNIKILYEYDKYDSAISRLFKKEHQYMSDKNLVVKALFLSGFPLVVRTAYFLILFLLINFMFININKVSDSKPKLIKSNRVQTLQLGVVKKNIYNKKFFPNGVMFVLNLNDNNALLPLSFDFTAGGFHQDGSFVVRVNNKIFYVSTKNDQCDEIESGEAVSMSKEKLSTCKKHLLISNEFLKPGKNSIVVARRYPKEKWLLGRILVESLRPLTAAESKEFNYYLKYAKERFDERKMSPHSVLYTEIYLEKIEVIKINKFLNEKQESNYLFLKKQTKDFIDDFIKKFWFDFEKNIRNRNYDRAQRDLIKMRGFYPNASTKRGRVLEHQLTRVRKLMGVEK